MVSMISWLQPGTFAVICLCLHPMQVVKRKSTDGSKTPSGGKKGKLATADDSVSTTPQWAQAKQFIDKMKRWLSSPYFYSI